MKYGCKKGYIELTECGSLYDCGMGDANIASAFVQEMVTEHGVSTIRAAYILMIESTSTAVLLNENPQDADYDPRAHRDSYRLRIAGGG
jgi:hypothetical protein